MKKIIIAIVIVLGIFLALFYRSNLLPQDPKEVTFTVSGTPVTLVGGTAQAKTNLGGDALTTIKYFGNEVVHDIDGDGVDDTVFLITQEAGTSVYFYAVGALKRKTGYIGSKAVLIGDHISPQTTEKGRGRMIIVNYAEGTNPSRAKSLWLLLDTKTLEFGEVVQDFQN